MFNVYICSDVSNSKILDKALIKELFERNKMEVFSILTTDSPVSIISKSRLTQNNIYLLGIALNKEMNGLQLAQEIRRNDKGGNIIFITKRLEFSLMPFQYKLKALDFIYDDETIAARLEECFDFIKFETGTGQSNYLLIKSGSNSYQIDYNDIIYFEMDSQKRKVIVHTETMNVEYYDTLQNIQSKLNSNFFRCHRAFIVNLNHISSIAYNKKFYELHLSNFSTCMVSKKYIKELKSLYNNVKPQTISSDWNQ